MPRVIDQIPRFPRVVFHVKKHRLFVALKTLGVARQKRCRIAIGGEIVFINGLSLLFRPALVPSPPLLRFYSPALRSAFHPLPSNYWSKAATALD